MTASPCREASSADMEAVVPLVAEFCRHFDYGFSEPRARASLEMMLADPKLGRLFVVENNRRVIGYLVVAFSFSLEYGGRTAFIDEFFIGPAGRGLGFGRRALDFVTEFCRSQKINAILLEAEESNPRATALYAKAGYEFLDRRLLTKRLSPEAGYKAPSRAE